MGKDRVALRPVGPPLPDRVAPVELTLATAVPKGDRFDWLVEKATELGVAALVPILTERSVVDPRAAKLDRLRRAVVEAAKQCGRNRLMTIERPDPLARLRPRRRRATRSGSSRTPAGRRSPTGRGPARLGRRGGRPGGRVHRGRGRRGRGAPAGLPVDLGATLLRIETAGLVAVREAPGAGRSGRSRDGDGRMSGDERRGRSWRSWRSGSWRASSAGCSGSAAAW